jgi:hypothetical protein
MVKGRLELKLLNKTGLIVRSPKPEEISNINLPAQGCKVKVEVEVKSASTSTSTFFMLCLLSQVV